MSDDTEQRLPPSVSLPMMPSVVTEFLAIARDPDTDIKQISHILERDANIACELLREVNSPLVGLRKKAATVGHAITFLGLKRTEACVTAAVAKRMLKASHSRVMNIKNHWSASIERALFARCFAGLLGADPDVAYAGALLPDVLLPMLTHAYADKYLELIASADWDRRAITLREQATFGWDHASAAAAAMNDWGFPDELVCCAWFHHHGLAALTDKRLTGTTVAAVAVAGLLPDAVRQSPQGVEHLWRLQSVWPKFDVLAMAGEVEELMREESEPNPNHLSFKTVCERRIAAQLAADDMQPCAENSGK